MRFPFVGARGRGYAGRRMQGKDKISAPLTAVIVGPGRSGSTALMGLLNQHPALFCLNESHALPSLRRHFGRAEGASRAMAECYLSLPFCPGPHWPAQSIASGSARQDEADLRRWLDQLCAAIPRMDVAQFHGHIYGYFQQASGASMVLDKTPDYAHHLDLIHEIWPAAKVILMLRDAPRSVLSMRCHRGYRVTLGCGAQSWAQLLADQPRPGDLPDLPAEAEPQDLAPFLDLWCARNRDALDHARALPRAQFMILKQENLIARPRREMSRLLAFLGLPWHEDWARLVAAEFRAPPARQARDLSEAEAALALHEPARRLRAELGYR